MMRFWTAVAVTTCLVTTTMAMAMAATTPISRPVTHHPQPMFIIDVEPAFEPVEPEPAPEPEPEPTEEAVDAPEEVAAVEAWEPDEPAPEVSHVSEYDGDFKSEGIVYSDGFRYSWYSDRVLPGGGLTELNENGRAYDSDGYVIDGEGYIAIASSDYAKGTVIETPFGQGKVYDSGCAPGTIDVYTNW